MLNVLLKDSSAASSVDEVISEATALKDEFDEELQVMIIFLCFCFLFIFIPNILMVLQFTYFDCCLFAERH